MISKKPIFCHILQTSNYTLYKTRNFDIGLAYQEKTKTQTFLHSTHTHLHLIKRNANNFFLSRHATPFSPGCVMRLVHHKLSAHSFNALFIQDVGLSYVPFLYYPPQLLGKDSGVVLHCLSAVFDSELFFSQTKGYQSIMLGEDALLKYE